MMRERDMQERPGLGRRLCCIAILGIVLAMGFGMVINTVIPDGLGDDLVVTETVVDGTAGSSIALSTGKSYTDLVLLNDSSFSREAGWKMDFNSLNEYAPRVERLSTESGIQLDFSNVFVSYYYETNFNLRDYESVTVSLDVKVLRGPIELSLYLDVFSFLSTPQFRDYSDRKSFTLTTGESTSVDVEVDTNSLYAMWSPLWLAQSFVGIEIYPISSNWYEWEDALLEASLLLENVTISATSTTPLSPLNVDIQDTQGSSVYESGVNLNLMEWPAVNLTSNEVPSKWGIFLPWRSNDTIYVPVGNYSGIAGFYSYNYSNDTFTASFEVLPNTTLLLGLRFEMVRVNLSVSQAVPYLRIFLWYSDYYFGDYGFEVAPPFPATFFIPKRLGTLYISIHTPPRLEATNLAYRMSIQVSDPVNIDIQLRIPMFPFFGIMLSTGEVLLIILGLALLMGAILSSQKPNAQKHWRQVLKDPRFWPAFLVGVSALVPWFISFSSLQQFTWSIGEPIIIHRSLYIPFALGLDTTTHSLATIVVSPYLLLDIPFRIIFLWLPLRWAFGYVGSPKRWKFNFYYTICISFPLLNGVLFYLYTLMPLTISIGFILVMAAPILWGFELLIYRVLKRNKK